MGEALLLQQVLVTPRNSCRSSRARLGQSTDTVDIIFGVPNAHRGLSFAPEARAAARPWRSAGVSHPIKTPSVLISGGGTAPPGWRDAPTCETGAWVVAGRDALTDDAHRAVVRPGPLPARGWRPGPALRAGTVHGPCDAALSPPVDPATCLTSFSGGRTRGAVAPLHHRPGTRPLPRRRRLAAARPPAGVAGQALRVPHPDDHAQHCTSGTGRTPWARRGAWSTKRSALPRLYRSRARHLNPSSERVRQR